MKRGFSLIEVLVALCICMAFFTAAARMSLFAVRTQSFAEAGTYAAVFGHTKLASLKNQPAASPELAPGWHSDAGNPISKQGLLFYRFWMVQDIPTGRKLTLSVAWDENGRGREAEFTSWEGLQASRCRKMTFSDFIVNE